MTAIYASSVKFESESDVKNSDEKPDIVIALHRLKAIDSMPRAQLTMNAKET